MSRFCALIEDAADADLGSRNPNGLFLGRISEPIWNCWCITHMVNVRFTYISHGIKYYVLYYEILQELQKA